MIGGSFISRSRLRVGTLLLKYTVRRWELFQRFLTTRRTNLRACAISSRHCGSALRHLRDNPLMHTIARTGRYCLTVKTPSSDITIRLNPDNQDRLQ